MAGLGVGGWGNFPGQPQNTVIPKPQQPEQSQRMSRGNFRNFQGRGRGEIDTAPKPQPFRGPAGGGGINTGRNSLLGILPSVGDPFRTYGTVENGRVIPPSNPYGQNQPIRFTPGGEWGGGGPINTGPTDIPWAPPPGGYGGYDPTQGRGGFTNYGQNMPPGMGSDTGGATAPKPGVPPTDRMTPYMPRIIPGGNPFGPIPGGGGMPPTRIPGNPQQSPFGNRRMGGGGFGRMYR